MALTILPNAGQNLAETRQPIKDNFDYINTGFLINHAGFNVGADTGKHKCVSFVTQLVSPPAAAFAAGEVGLYSFLYPTTNKNELFVNKTNQLTITQIPATASILSISSAPVALSAGWSYLPSGILLKWSAEINANGTTAVLFPAGAPAFTTCMTVIVQIAIGGAGDADKAVRLVGVSPVGFTVYGSNRTSVGAAAVTFTYLAIGY